jgi:hypothetical protein
MSLFPKAARLLAGLMLSAGLATAAEARAPDRIFSYDPVSDSARTLAPGGLTFIFRKQMLGGTRVLQVLSTQQKGTAELKPADEKDLGPGGLAGVVGHKVDERNLYEIEHKGQGEPLIRAACTYADRAWLAFGELKPNRNLIIHAVGRNLATGKIFMCATMEFSWHGEWKLPSS